MRPRGQKSHCVRLKRGINYPKNLEERGRYQSETDQDVAPQEEVLADLLEA